MENPKLRPLDVVPYDDNSAVIRDPSGISSKMLLVSRDVLFICSLCNGETSMTAIQEEWRKVFGQPLADSRIDEILRQLDECYFLENPRFFREKYRIEQDFLNSPVRKPFHAGTGYNNDPKELKDYLDKKLTQKSRGRSDRLSGIIAPHIDISRGIDCYASVYNYCYSLTNIDLVIILGVSHSMSKRSIILTDKDFETPFGVVRTDHAVIESLKGRLQYDFFADEILHRSEHSIEFQVLFLQHVLKSCKDVTILPVLCSECGNLQEEAGIFTDALLSCIEEEKRSPFFIAGADLSHLGRRFGQEKEMSRDFLNWAEAKDREMLQKVCAGDPEDFLKEIKKENNSRNVCGVPAIYTMMKLIGPVPSELVCYDQAVEKDTNSMVSFAGILFS